MESTATEAVAVAGGSMSYLLDTDICSNLLKTNALAHRFLQHLGRLHISVVTLAELKTWALRGNAPPRRMQGIVHMMNDVAVLDVTPDVAHRFGEIQAALLDSGHPAPGMDLLIASTALVHSLTLVTHNVADYVNVPGLNVEDWLQP
jgi:tRNA(fMet)-specific endonuclease VapC